LTVDSQQERQGFNTESTEAGAQRATEKAANPGGVVQKTKNPNQTVGAQKTRRAGALLKQKSALGRAGTHFSTGLILQYYYVSCQVKF